MIDKLTVKYHDEIVGILSLTPDNRLCVFEYDKAWLSNGFSISPLELPLRSGLFIAKPTPFYGNFGVFEVTIPDSWIGKTVAEVDIRRKYSINILAFKMGKVFNCNILPNTVFDVDRTLLVVGELKNIEKCFKVKGGR